MAFSRSTSSATSQSGSVAVSTITQTLSSCSAEDITENVSRAIEAEEEVKQKSIKDHIPTWMQNLFKEFAGVTGSKAHRDLLSRTLVYYRFVLQK